MKKKNSIKIVIVGSREWDWFSVFKKTTLSVISEIQYNNPVNYLDFEIIVPKCNAGVGKMSVQFANSFNIPLRVFKADWHNMETERRSVGISTSGVEYNKLAGFNRNLKMIEYANIFDKSIDGIANSFLIAFQQNKSKGTQNTISEARDFKMKTYYFTVEYGIQLKLRTLGFDSKLNFVRF